LHGRLGEARADPVGQTHEQLVNFRTAVTAKSQISASLLDMELDEIFCPDASDLPPPAPDYDDALEM
jgi:hypothetical protein